MTRDVLPATDEIQSADDRYCCVVCAVSDQVHGGQLVRVEARRSVHELVRAWRLARRPGKLPRTTLPRFHLRPATRDQRRSRRRAETAKYASC